MAKARVGPTGSLVTINIGAVRPKAFIPCTGDTAAIVSACSDCRKNWSGLRKPNLE